jgi:hypothetical protein
LRACPAPDDPQPTAPGDLRPLLPRTLAVSQTCANRTGVRIATQACNDRMRSAAASELETDRELERLGPARAHVRVRGCRRRAIATSPIGVPGELATGRRRATSQPPGDRAHRLAAGVSQRDLFALRKRQTAILQLPAPARTHTARRAPPPSRSGRSWNARLPTRCWVHLPDGLQARTGRARPGHQESNSARDAAPLADLDQGAEMRDWEQVRIDTGIDIYFCDPNSPWQRGTNENTNGVQRQQLPKAPTSPPSPH